MEILHAGLATVFAFQFMGFFSSCCHFLSLCFFVSRADLKLTLSRSDELYGFENENGDGAVIASELVKAAEIISLWMRRVKLKSFERDLCR
jgi:hypothetical protein